ncbi:MAG: endolytic transglycosylase MltG [Eubacteriales bacterium]|nr:endolytic transglycosylase MltG [Bacillota bacterium]MBV1727434.1 endolytic transglycosylase MltG [Desulforudis sp.]MDQ7788793.1 endolytic transglycosylase MltG [Clostridia bacterium]MDZ4043675.1 endolytic transglycosylase MltG [Eubacteriales bacterium]MBU4555030.1 endolytic transglycosylase MltG [Bacillota bacterium]
MSNRSHDQKERSSAQGVMGSVMGFVGLLTVLLAVVGLSVSLSLGPASSANGDPAHLEIPRNASTADIALVLKEEGLIRNPLLFRLYARYVGADGTLQAGLFAVPRGLSVAEILDVLRTSQVSYSSVTIPEGYNTAQIADLLVAKGLVTEDEFWAAVIDSEYPYAYIEDLPRDERRLEGYLFPDTYLIHEGASSREIISVMLTRFNREAKKLDLSEKAREAGMSLHELVTIASMLEKEASTESDRKLISGVIQKRMDIGMPLQICFTVIYALGDPTKQVVLYEDLQIQSPYNTYLHLGLPPGPIANPGSVALRAALEPTASNYLYYLAKSDGSHVFSRTLAEHNAAKVKYIQ